MSHLEHALCYLIFNISFNYTIIYDKLVNLCFLPLSITDGDLYLFIIKIPTCSTAFMMTYYYNNIRCMRMGSNDLLHMCHGSVYIQHIAASDTFRLFILH